MSSTHRHAQPSTVAAAAAAATPQAPAGPAANGTSDELPEVPYGGLLGVAPFGIAAFSNGSEEHFSGELSYAPANRPGYELELGYKWQCVEFVRRAGCQTRGVWFKSVPVAEQMWQETTVIDIRTGAHHPLRRLRNGGEEPPQVGDVLVWRRSHTMPFGHVAMVTEVGEDFVRIAEQNLEFRSWGGRNFARELRMKRHTKAPGAAGSTGSSRSSSMVGPGGRRPPQAATRASGGDTTPPPDIDAQFFNSEIAPPLIANAGDTFEVYDEDPLLGWMRPDCPFVNPYVDDVMDIFRYILGRGSIQRVVFDTPPDTSLAWLNPSASPTDFFLRRSLVGKDAPKDAAADPSVVPNGYYKIDYDLWMRARTAAVDLHARCLRVAHDVLSLDPEQRDAVLQHRFGFPPELAPLMVQSLKDTAPLGGRFDLGLDDAGNLKMLEYNCDSSAALLECCDTQEKWAEHVGIGKVGVSTGSFLKQRLYAYWVSLLNSPRCPPGRLVHFMIDDDDEERYTALTMMHAAKAAGFNCKLCIKLVDFRYSFDTTTGEPIIVDLEGQEVRFVWKTWSWDTVLKDYAKQKQEQQGGGVPQSPGPSGALTDNNNSGGSPSTATGGSVTPLDAASDDGTVRAKRPTLSAILLNPRVRVLEPLWKVIVGSKALLPYVYEANKCHPNILPASFTATDEITEFDYVSKPVHGRAGQNITMYDGRKCKHTHKPTNFTQASDEAPEVDLSRTSQLQTPLGCTPSSPLTMFGKSAQSTDDNSFSGGRFADDLFIYQRRIHLRKFHDGLYPILCAWVIEGDFGGLVIREDTSKITKLDSIVIPARVVRN